MISSEKLNVAVNDIGNHNSNDNKSNKWNEQPHIGKYKLIKTIGKGNFAKVKLAQHVTTGKKVAVKVIDKTALNNSSLQKLFREVKIMKTLEHPNIVKLFEVIESERHVYLVMEYASKGEVFDFLVQNGRMKEIEARQRFREIVSAIQYCHHKNIVHRDLKAENLLLCNSLEIKIADFGFANNFDCKKQLDTFCGSPPYAAPELFQGRKYEGPEVDVWSLGVILYTLVSGSLPFDGHNMRELRERVLKGKYRVPFYMSTDCELLLKKMLIVSPQKRYTLLEVMKDKWINMGYEDSMLKPYTEPPKNYEDPLRLAIMENLGFSKEEVLDSLYNAKFNNVTATYLLLDHDVNNALENSSKSASISSLKNITSHLPVKEILKIKLSDNDKSSKAVTKSGSTVEGRGNVKVARDSDSKGPHNQTGKDYKSLINDAEKTIKAKSKKISNIKQSPSMGTTYSNDEVPLTYETVKSQVNPIRIPGIQPKINPIAPKVNEDKVELNIDDRLLIPVKGNLSVKRNNTFTYADKHTTSEVESKPVTRTKPVLNMYSHVSPSTPFSFNEPITITSNEQASNEIIFQHNTSDNASVIIDAQNADNVSNSEPKCIKNASDEQPKSNGDHSHLNSHLFDNNPTIIVAVEEDFMPQIASDPLDKITSVNNSASNDHDSNDPYPQLSQAKQIHSGSLFRSFTNKISSSKLVRRLTTPNVQVHKSKKRPSEYVASNSTDPWTPMTSGTMPTDNMKISTSSDLLGEKHLILGKAHKTYTLKTNQSKPRLMHLVFRKNITSKLQPDIIISEMLKSLYLIEEIEFKKVEQIDSFVIECEGRLKSDSEYIYWEIEVFRLPRSSSFGIRIKKESGSSTRFKAMQKLLINKLSPVLCSTDSYLFRH